MKIIHTNIYKYTNNNNKIIKKFICRNLLIEIILF